MEMIKNDKKKALIIITVIIIFVAGVIFSSTEDLKRIQKDKAENWVYQITNISQDGKTWSAIDGPETYQVGQGGLILAVTNQKAKVGDLVTKAGVMVDQYGNPL